VSYQFHFASKTQDSSEFLSAHRDISLLEVDDSLLESSLFTVPGLDLSQKPSQMRCY
jgi:hypothetical protein